ncbi:MAG TPA: serine protease [Thermoanaerobaculia bacterium]|jgi:hypothetical protein|nr:serine protease [Thermoanaerobaculia bacterium]HEV8608830.1 serine protease [Thermoanaerobaculia bacterium]
MPVAIRGSSSPLEAVGVVYRGQEPNDEYLGTCFALYFPRKCFLTAAHCIGDLPAHELFVVTQIWGQTESVVERVIKHPTADLAILVLPPDSGVMARSFWGCAGYQLGEDFYAYGYPVDVLGENAKRPTARLFKGHFQTFSKFRSLDGRYEYEAAELSIPCPAGLSGGPLFNMADQRFAIGMATENRDSRTTLDSWEEEQQGSEVRKSIYQEIIRYGVALLLKPLEPWLKSQIIEPYKTPVPKPSTE